MSHELPPEPQHDDDTNGSQGAAQPQDAEPTTASVARGDEGHAGESSDVAPADHSLLDDEPAPDGVREPAPASSLDEEDEAYKGPLFPWEIEEQAATEELSPEERARRAETDRLLLTHYGIYYSVISITALGLAAGLGIPGADMFLRGLTVGCTMAVLNLHLLAKACWGVLTGQRGMGSLAGFGLSFALLMASAYWLVLHHPEWLLGFGFGLTLPVLVGFSYAFHLRKEAKRGR